MIVCITEKPSVAKDIASILGADIRRDGFYEGNGYKITWTFGHLCTLKEPQDYTDRWKTWSLGVLPMIPPKFGIRLINDKGIEKQFHVIEALIKEADEVVNCGDAGQEGELIQRWVMQKAECRKPVKRLWISSLTDESIREGFKNLRPQSDFDSLYFAGLSRAIGDWILGMNATRLFTLKYAQNRNVLSIGRVQTPTLALVVARQKEIDNFVPEDFWEIKTLYKGVTFNSTKGRYKVEAEAQNVIEQIKDLPLVINSFTTKRGKEYPPKLFDLTSLQVECNKRYGYSAEETLRLIQSLYEKKFTTYPRVDTTYLSEDIYPKVPGVLKALTPYANFTAPVLEKKIPKTKKVFDNSKVTDHHAIIPTGQPPQNLTDMERRVFDLIARRFIAVFYPDCLFATTTVIGEVEQIEFKVSGKQILEPGWRVVFGTPSAQSQEEKDEKGGEEENVLPAFVVGESGPHLPDLYEKWTQPPRPYTEATLLRAMETAGKLVDNDELRDALKENGIGRPSTRAAIIETLFKRNYIRKEKKNLIATPTGVELIQIIHEELLKSAELTGIWEKKLREIEKRTYNAGQFLEELKQMVSEIVMSVLSDNSNRHITIQAPAPEKGGKNSASSASASDKPKKEPKKRAPQKSAAKKTETATTDSLPAAAEQPASVVQADELVGQPCPLCGKGTVIKGKTAYGCSEWKSGCTFRKPF